MNSRPISNFYLKQFYKLNNKNLVDAADSYTFLQREKVKKISNKSIVRIVSVRINSAYFDNNKNHYQTIY